MIFALCLIASAIVVFWIGFNMGWSRGWDFGFKRALGRKDKLRQHPCRCPEEPSA